MQKNNSFRHQKGIALLVVLSSIALLTILMYAFQFETSFNQIRSYNIQDHLQAKLNAESGTQLAIMRLEIYKEAYNQLQKNKDYKKFVSANTLNEIWSMPMIFPIPKTNNLSIMETGFIDKFQDQSWLVGQLQISIESLGSKINLNLLADSKLRSIRFNKNKKKKTTEETGTGGGGQGSTDEDKKNEDENDPSNISKLIGEKLTDMLERGINQKKETDEEFYQRYSSTDIQYLVSAIKYYVSDENVDVGPMTTQLEADFQKAKISPKHAPMSSLSEILLLPEWNDDLLGLIKNEVSVNDSFYLDLNKMTESFLKLLVPDINQNQITQFFKIKNDPKAALNFSGKDDFVNFMGGQIRVDEKELKDNMEQLEKAGFKFTNAPNLFKIRSIGTYGRSEVTLLTTVVLPEKSEDNNDQNGGSDSDHEPPTPTPTSNPKEEKPVMLDSPSILEVTQF